MAPLNVTPITLSQMVKTLTNDPLQKDEITRLQHTYTEGGLTKDDFSRRLGSICGSDAMVKALRILVPGYEEMRGVTAPAPIAAVPPSQPAGTPRLMKGFLSSGSIAPKGGDSPGSTLPTKPKEAGSMLEGIDVDMAREQYHSHMRDNVPRMGTEQRDHLLHNNFVMHDAKSAGNGGNVVLGPGGVAEVVPDDAMGGQAARYSWGQNESEITIKVGGLPKGTKAKDVRLTTKTLSIQLRVCDEEICVGSLHKPILADESTYVIEDEPGATSGGKRLLTVSLTKRDATGGKGHWPCVVVGDDGTIDPNKFGPQVLVADPNNPREFVHAMKSLEVGSEGGPRGLTADYAY